MGLKKNSKKLLHVSIIGAGYMAEEHIKALKKFKNVKAEEIAQLMAKKSSDSSNGINIYTRLDI